MDRSPKEQITPEVVIHGKEWKLPQGPIDLKPNENQDFTGRKILAASVTSSQLKLFKNQRVCIFGYLITLKPVRTVKGEMMYFGCFIDHEGNYLDTIHFPPVLKQFPFRGVGVYKLEGKVVDEFGFLSLEVNRMHKMPRQMDPRAGKN